MQTNLFENTLNLIVGETVWDKDIPYCSPGIIEKVNPSEILVKYDFLTIYTYSEASKFLTKTQPELF